MSQYLDAMGIPIWSQNKAHKQAPGIKPYWVKLDASVVSAEKPYAHPIVLTVLKLLNIGVDECTFSSVKPEGSKLVWSLGSHQKGTRVVEEQVLDSKSLASLESSSDAKRQLWEALYQLEHYSGRCC